MQIIYSNFLLYIQEVPTNILRLFVNKYIMFATFIFQEKIVVKMIRPLTPELAKIAKDELNENPNQVASDLQHLKDWISKQPHLRARTGTYKMFL